MASRNMSRRGRKPPASPFLPPPTKTKDINLIDNSDELVDLLQRTNERLTRCPPTIRETLEERRSKIEARLEQVNSISKVAADLRDTHIDQLITPDDVDDVLMDGVVSSPPLPSAGHDAMTNHHQTMSTKAKIFATPVIPQPVNKPNPRGIRMMDDQTSLRIQQEEMLRHLEHQRTQKAVRAAKERKLLAHTEEAAARVATASDPQDGIHQPYQEDMERRARIIAFMNYQPYSDQDCEDDDDTEGELDDEAMEALLEAEFEDGTKGQAIIDPDSLEDLIRVDTSHLLDTDMAHEP